MPQEGGSGADLASLTPHHRPTLHRAPSSQTTPAPSGEAAVSQVVLRGQIRSPAALSWSRPLSRAPSVVVGAPPSTSGSSSPRRFLGGLSCCCLSLPVRRWIWRSWPWPWMPSTAAFPTPHGGTVHPLLLLLSAMGGVWDLWLVARVFAACCLPCAGGPPRLRRHSLSPSHGDGCRMKATMLMWLWLTRDILRWVLAGDVPAPVVSGPRLFGFPAVCSAGQLWPQ